MLRRLAHALIALIVALAAAMPTGVRAMPMPAAVSGMAVDRPCPNCPEPDRTGRTNPDRMPACQLSACVGSLAMLPAPVLVRGRALFRVAYVTALPPRWTEAAPAPDPFPPRPIVLL